MIASLLPPFGSLARELCLAQRENEESFLAAMFQSLGRLLKIGAGRKVRRKRGCGLRVFEFTQGIEGGPTH